MANKALIIGALLAGGALLLLNKKKTEKVAVNKNPLLKNAVLDKSKIIGNFEILTKIPGFTTPNTIDPVTNPKGYKAGDRVSYRHVLSRREGIITQILGTEVTLNTISEGQITIPISRIVAKRS